MSASCRLRTMPRVGLVSMYRRAMAKFMIWRNRLSALLASANFCWLSVNDLRYGRPVDHSAADQN